MSLSLCVSLSLFFVVVYVFFFKQKTAYEMRISDWSSDVCSSDLAGYFWSRWGQPCRICVLHSMQCDRITPGPRVRCVSMRSPALPDQIGRASCRERVCQYV